MYSECPGWKRVKYCNAVSPSLWYILHLYCKKTPPHNYQFTLNKMFFYYYRGKNTCFIGSLFQNDSI